MTSLQDTLPALSTIVPEVPHKMHDLLDAAQAVDRASVAFLNEIESQREEAAQALSSLHHALAELAGEADQSKTSIEQATSAVEQASDQTVSGLEEQAHALKADMSAVQGGLEAIEKELTAGIAGVRDGEAAIKEAMSQVEHAAAAGGAPLESAAQSVVHECHTLASSLAEVQTQFSQGVHNVDAAVHATLTNGHARLEQTLTTLQQLAHDLAAKIQAQTHALDEQQKEIVAAVKGAIENEVFTKAQQAVSGAEEALTGLGEMAAQAAGETKESAGSLETHFGELRHAMEPLPAAVERVKQAAADVGLSWG
jgi:chromosome segregation ATPase